MTGLANRLARIEKNFHEDLEFFDREYGNDPQYDTNGGLTTSKKSIKRLFSLCDYKLRHDIKGFRKHLSEAASLRKSLFDRYNQGEPIDESFISMHSFGYILDALAAGDFELANAFAIVIGGRPEIEKENDHPFDLAFGYALKSLILNHQTDLEHWLPIANAEVKRRDVKYFQAYVDGLYAIKNKDENAFKTAIKQLVRDHRKMCQYGGLFENNDDEVLCFWGLGLINLARKKGLAVTIDDEYLPEELII